jgi:mercuric ion transport protein
VTPTGAIASEAREHRLLGYLGLFSSVGTLVCCALPSLLVLLGLGATVASVLANAPWLVTLSRHKAWLFAASALLIAGNFYYVYRLAPRLLARSGACDVDDPTCARASRTSRGLLWVSAFLLAAGFSVAYVLPAILGWLDT